MGKKITKGMRPGYRAPKKTNIQEVKRLKQEIRDSITNGLFQGDNIVAKINDEEPGGIGMRACEMIEEIISRASSDIYHASKIKD